MIRKLCVLACLGTLAMSGSTWAQAPQETCGDDNLPCRFIIYEIGSIIDGHANGPDGLWFESRRTFVADSLLELKTSFIDEIILSAEEVAMQ